MTEQQQADPILDSHGPIVTIEGRDYPLRRLGLQDVFRVVRILGNGISVLVGSGQVDVKTSKLAVDPGLVVQVLLASMQRHESDIMQLMADLIGVERAELDDAERFPITAILDLYEALAQHQDLLAFLARVEAMMSRVPALREQAQQSAPGTPKTP